MSSPASLPAVMSAFQSGLRKKAMRAHGDNQWDERQQAVEAENATQERIRRRMPGRQQTGAFKTGDIDGAQ
jgi:exocyst complex component 4